MRWLILILIALFCAGCGPDPEAFKRDKAQIIKQIETYYKAGKHAEARKITLKYFSLNDKDILKWYQKNHEAHLTKLKTELTKLDHDQYKRRDEILTKLISIDEKDGGKHYAARLENQKLWDIAKANKTIPKTGIYENDCDSRSGKSLAHIMLQKWVKQKLVSPATAKFPWSNRVKINVHKPCDFEIAGYVDSQNEFGALVRTQYRGVLRRDLSNKDHFTLMSLEMGD